MKHNEKQYEAFFALDKPRQDAVILLFEDALTDEEIAKAVHRSRSTLSNWKQQPLFQQACDEYRRLALDNYVPEAIRELQSLAIHAKSETVRLRAITSILGLAGFGNVGENPTIESAKIRKAKAEATLAEEKVNGFQQDDLDNIALNIIVPREEPHDGS